MHKIWHWIRGDNDPKSEFWQGAVATDDKRRWRSSMIARTASRKKRGRENGGANNGTDIAHNFDAIQAASTSTPTVLPSRGQRQQKAETEQYSGKGRQMEANGQEKGHKRSTKRNRDNDKYPHASESASTNWQNGTDRQQRRNKTHGIGVATTTQVAATTEDIPRRASTTKYLGDNFRVEKKSVSANEMATMSGSGEKGGLLQKIRQRFRRHPSDRKQKMTEMDNEVGEQRMMVTMTVAVEATKKGDEEEVAKHRLGDTGRIGDVLGEDEASQGRCSSFDYFSATASPTDQPATDRDPEPYSSGRIHRDNGGGGDQDEPRFATEAEARAYLRREGEGEGSESEEFDADDEITTLTTSAMCDSQLTQRPHSAMACAAGQRESVYFTATVVVQSATPETGRRNVQQDQRTQKFDFPRQKSNSQLVLGQEEHDAMIVGGQGSEPGSTKLSRRRLRFVIPQVSICSAESASAADAANNNSEAKERGRGEFGQNGQGLGAMSKADESNNNADQELIAGLEVEDESAMTEQDKQLRKALSEFDRRELTLAQRRQSNMDFVHQASGRRTSTTLIPLTSAQIHLIRSLWRQVYLSKGPTVIGSQISHRLFFKEPEIRELFRRCPLPPQFANHDSFSKAHCKRVSEIIDQVVECLDDLETVSPVLERIGRCHAHVSGGQLSSKVWNSAAETFIDCTLEWGDRRARSETVRKAWALIVAFMVERIKHGHLEERRHITAIRSTIASLERVASSSGGDGSAPSVQPYFDFYQIQQPSTSSSIQLPLPSTACPIRRVSAYATPNSAAMAVPNGSHAADGIRKCAVSPADCSPEHFRRVVAAGAVSKATYANVSPYMNRRKHHHHRSEKDKSKSQQNRPQRSSSSSAPHHSPKTGSTGTSRRRVGAPGTATSTRSRTDSQRKTIGQNATAGEGQQQQQPRWSDV